MTLSDSYEITPNENDSSVESSHAESDDCNEGDDIIPDEFRDDRTQEEFKWPENYYTPYKLSENYTEDQRNLIKSAMEEVMKKTCVKFIARMTENSYVYIQVHSLFYFLFIIVTRNCGPGEFTIWPKNGHYFRKSMYAAKCVTSVPFRLNQAKHHIEFTTTRFSP